MKSLNKYCTECGSALKDGLEFCTECGQKVNNPEVIKQERTTAPAKKQPKVYTKKQKVIFTVAASVFILLVGFYMWGNNYYSAEKTVDRFIAAITEEDVD